MVSPKWIVTLSDRLSILSSVKISELSRRSGVPLATIKFYRRERLLPPGAATAPNQARYDDRHVRRLALIRALRETGGLSLATIGRIVTALDAHDVPIHALVGEVVDSLGEENRRAASAEPEREAAAADVDRFLAGQGLPVRAEGTARSVLIDALVTLRWRVTPGLPVETFAPYVAAMRDLTRWEITQRELLMGTQPLDGAPAESVLLEFIVYGTVLFEPVILAIRRLLHEAEFLGGEIPKA